MEANFIIIGLPASGKTTFLAALWHLVESGEAESRLQLDSYEGDLAYLNKIAEAWRNFQKVPRTSQVGDANVSIRLADRVTGGKATVFFPDLAGETFDAQVETRQCRPEFVHGVAKGVGILLFVSADVTGHHLSVVELNGLLPKQEEGVSTGTDQNEQPFPRSEWEPKFVPAQVRIVQLLSDLLRPPFEARRRNVVIMISAWDLVKNTGLAPKEWLAANMPLLYQFLRSNCAWFNHEIYGVSAQGLDLNDSSAIHSATSTDASRRILIVGPGSEGHDLTSPLAWLMSVE
ncbi:TRAFAC clade GTPase domain-containing protein [Camelimonas lactis]|uniref:Double-GTPase 1 domain-containing protein n=1 Tax=Camelimonas lactis TaxID=659006 RepID=A0A4R2GG10_9HYPH|nr:hypothetical protein [Camelimonas lactis]TCO07178.1 hypothetical protein EV666_1365 [Camelimonas lactis]